MRFFQLNKLNVLVLLKILIVAAPFRTPDLSNIHYNDYNFIEYKKGLIKRGVGLAADSHFQQKGLFGQTYPLRYGELTMVHLYVYPNLKDSFIVYERELKDKVITNIPLTNIIAIEPQVHIILDSDGQPNEKNIYPFLIREPDRETVLAVDDDSSRKQICIDNVTCSSWIRQIASLVILQMASSGIINEENFKQ